MPVRRVFVEKKAGFDIEAQRLKTDIAGFLGGTYPCLAALADLRLLNRYDVEHLDEQQFRQITDLVLSEPQADRVFYQNTVPAESGSCFFGIEYVSGQYDQRADSAEQCAELVAGVRPTVRTARIVVLKPVAVPISAAALEAVKRYLINPVDSQEVTQDTPDLPASLETEDKAVPDVPILEDFCRSDNTALEKFLRDYGLAMSYEDIRFCQDYFRREGRDPTLAEIRILDTYWSDHCRHTTFTTVLEKLEIEPEIENGPLSAALRNAVGIYEQARQEVYGDSGEKAVSGKPVTLMDIATIGTKVLKKRGLLDDLDESEEINACTVKIQAEFENGATEPWLLLFKNETHNHPTEIEPFGGAATCLGGAIRDPLSGRAFVHQAMRVTGGGDPRSALSETLPGKLPQIKIAREAAAGYAGYGNQIGLATGQVSEFYHSGFNAKRMELGAVIAAVPAAWVRREKPESGDIVLLVGGKTGRDGIGGATGSSKAHTGESVEKSGAEVQKGNAVEERKIQRLFRKREVCALIKRCNDFGAGGVSVAVGELAPGLDIDLDAVPKKYAGLDGVELAISESQERMAVVIAAADVPAFVRHAAAENLDAVVIAKVTSGGDSEASVDAFTDARLRMNWRGKNIADLSRSFLDTHGAGRSASAKISAYNTFPPIEKTVKNATASGLLDMLKTELASLRSCSRRGLTERFDGSIGAASVLFPWGGKTQGTPECGMAALLPSLDRESNTASLMTFGYDPDLMSKNPYLGAKGAIREALAKYACIGGELGDSPWKARLSLQEYFPRTESPESWGQPAAALLGALEAQLALGVPAIGGKDSMSGNYRDPDHSIDIKVPPTLAAFAAGTANAATIRSGALQNVGSVIILLYQRDHPASEPNTTVENEWEIFRSNMTALSRLSKQGFVHSAYPVGAGGVAAALAVTAFGNMIGIEACSSSFAMIDPLYYQGSVLVELDGKAFSSYRDKIDAALGGAFWTIAGYTINGGIFRIVDTANQQEAEIPLTELRTTYESTLERVYPQTTAGQTVSEQTAIISPAVSETASTIASKKKAPASYRTAAPLAVLPVFPGTNCEWDMERAFKRSGGRTQIVLFRNRSREDILESTAELAAAIGNAQIVALSGGFSAGDEPDGSGKFIANVFRSGPVAEAVTELLEKRGGLMLGICNGFQALIKLGLVPYGKILSAGENAPTLTFNRIGRHVSRMVNTRIMPNLSPWLAMEEPGAIHVIPVSHGEGRVEIGISEAQALFASGQIPCCYADAEGRPSMACPDNPNGSNFAIEAMCSPDGRVLGKMGHSERRGPYVHINIPGNKYQKLFEGGVSYFQ
ncbi:phosphoribosylformylglycinamidine synthase [Spirochaetia bacterium]|nr:phosphoribosylformylglycinamidine synthase [Spirochaetia bacterium]